jgi:hypothetical protein
VALRAAVLPHLEMPDMHGKSLKDISPSGREPGSEDSFIAQNWTALLKLRNRGQTKVEDGRRLLRLLPPRRMRSYFLFQARV